MTRLEVARTLCVPAEEVFHLRWCNTINFEGNVQRMKVEEYEKRRDPNFSPNLCLGGCGKVDL
jgi:hypothetical protein